MAYTDSSFEKIAVGTELTVLDLGKATHKGTFVSATNGTLTIYWKTYDKNKSWPYANISGVEILGRLMNADGSVPPIYKPSNF